MIDDENAGGLIARHQARSGLGVLVSKLFQCAGLCRIASDRIDHTPRCGPVVGDSFLHSTHPFMFACVCSQAHTHALEHIRRHAYSCMFALNWVVDPFTASLQWNHPKSVTLSFHWTSRSVEKDTIVDSLLLTGLSAGTRSGTPRRWNC